MQITTLNLRNFRNYARLDLTLRAGATLFYGPNAAGKTSILEAVALLALSRSPRTHSDRELIFWLADHTPETPATARVTGMIARHHGPTRLDVIIQQRGDTNIPGSTGGAATKILRVDQQPIRASDLLGFLRVVFFAPTDLDLLTGAPSERRRWLDAMLSQLDAHYLRMLNQYTKVMTQRHALLRQWRERGRTPRNASAELSFWDEQLAQSGAYITCTRAAAINELILFAQPIYTKISDNSTSFLIYYMPNIEISSFEEKEVCTQLLHAYHASHSDDIARMQTSIGPHRDDIHVRDGAMDLGTFGSRGQQRSGVMALKLAEVEFMTIRTGERPVLLLDDVLSELDLQRRNHLLEAIVVPNQQTLLTATGIEDFDTLFLRDAQLMRVDNAHVFDLST
ncbi:MAG: DNA replication/repair protein RecF [Chloroflexales bacterium]|nr:DNA replication/repair protein RecF [Chloroflexales bacterium]